MNIVFFGSSKYSTIVERSLFEKFGISLVVTLPDRELGRKKNLTPNPVKKFALDHKIPVLTAEQFSHSAIQQLKNVSPDFFVVADFGLILSKELLEIPKKAALNVHHSLLPKYRGPSPAPTAILNGDKVSGVTIIRMTKEVDAGDILNQKEYELKKDETTDSLLTKLNELGAEIIVPIIENYSSVKPIAQDESKATFTKRMNKQDGFVDIENPPSAEIIDRMIRAYYPWPNAWTVLSIKNKVLRIKFMPASPAGGQGGPDKKIQAEGGKPMSIKDFLNGYPQAKPLLQKIF